jgi:hypothetical protein
MANVKISALPTATAATGVDVVPLVQSGVTKKLSMTALLTSPTLFGSGMSTFLATPSSDNLRAVLTDETGTGAAVFATSPTLTTPTVTGPTVSTGNLTFSSTAQRITGDFSNATVANRLMFQTSTVNGNTSVAAIPNGTSVQANIRAFANSDPTNASFTDIGADPTVGSFLRAERAGTGTFLPMTFWTFGSEKLRIAADATGTYTFGGTAPRITGDMSNATASNRLAFQTSTTNASTGVFILPNGTGPQAALLAFNNSDPTNAAAADVRAISTDIRFSSLITGTGTYLPMTFYTGGSERVRVDTSGNVSLKTTTSFGGPVGGMLNQGEYHIATDGKYIRWNTYFDGSTTKYYGNGSAGLIGLGSGDGLEFYTCPTNVSGAGAVATGTLRLKLDLNGNVNIPTLGARITGDFTNATVANRLAFQTSTANSTTSVAAIPSGTGTVANFSVVNNSTPTNASVGLFQATSTVIAITTSATGSGTTLPITFNVPGEVARIDTSGNVIQGTAAVATTATAGFLWITSCAGVPTGAPTAPYTNAAAMVCDTTNNRLYVRVAGTWRYATLT